MTCHLLLCASHTLWVKCLLPWKVVMTVSHVCLALPCWQSGFTPSCGKQAQQVVFSHLILEATEAQGPEEA